MYKTNRLIKMGAGMSETYSIDLDNDLIEIYYERGNDPFCISCSGNFFTIDGALEQLAQENEYDHEDTFCYGDGTYLFNIRYDNGDYDYDCDGIKVCIAAPYYDFDLVSFKKYEGE